MPGSSTAPGRPGARNSAPVRLAFRQQNGVGAREDANFAAQWLAYAIPCRRFACILADTCARLGADVVCYSFIVVDFHHLLLAGLPAHSIPAAGGRRIRLLDGTTVSKAGKDTKKNNGLWRLHCTFDLPAERFSFIELTDEKGGERLDRTPFVKGDIAIADRGFMHPDPLAHILEQGAEVIVRTGWKGAHWLGGDRKPFDILAALAAAGGTGVLGRPIWVGRKKAPPLALRLVAFRKPPEAAAASRAKARAAAKREGYAISGGTLAAAGWVILVTSLDAKTFPTARIGELYRARWRIEMAFKRLKSLIGLSAPPSEDSAVAKTWILAHLLMILLLEPHTSAPEISPRMAA